MPTGLSTELTTPCGRGQLWRVSHTLSGHGKPLDNPMDSPSPLLGGAAPPALQLPKPADTDSPRRYGLFFVCFCIADILSQKRRAARWGRIGGSSWRIARCKLTQKGIFPLIRSSLVRPAWTPSHRRRQRNMDHLTNYPSKNCAVCRIARHLFSFLS